MKKAILVALQRPNETDREIQDNLAELAELAEDAGLEVVDQVIQKRSKPEVATLIGIGKVEEVKGLLSGEDDVVIFDEELSPAQSGNLSELLDVPVLDRTQLILDIFARRAQSKEGKIQVELAQLRYLLPRLTGKGEALSRLGGGIGTRGPGETKLETDRRRIRKRIADLQAEIDLVQKVRDTQRVSRLRNDVPLVALVGYTNAGKSTLLTALTGEQTFAADQLFATLDPLIRRWHLSENQWVYLSDTVGFIRKLPHTLVAAFRATLEEVLHADLVLHVIDASHPQCDQQKVAVEEVLREIGCDSPVINVYNKIDQVNEFFVSSTDVKIAALTGENLEELTQKVLQFFQEQYVVNRYFFPFNKLAEASVVYDQGNIMTEEYREDGVILQVELKKNIANRLTKWEIP